MPGDLKCHDLNEATGCSGAMIGHCEASVLENPEPSEGALLRGRGQGLDLASGPLANSRRLSCQSEPEQRWLQLGAWTPNKVEAVSQ